MNSSTSHDSRLAAGVAGVSTARRMASVPVRSSPEGGFGRPGSTAPSKLLPSYCSAARPVPTELPSAVRERMAERAPRWAPPHTHAHAHTPLSLPLPLNLCDSVHLAWRSPNATAASATSRQSRQEPRMKATMVSNSSLMSVCPIRGVVCRISSVEFAPRTLRMLCQ